MGLAASLTAQITFSAPHMFSAGISAEPDVLHFGGSQLVVSGDFNRDGYLDVAAASSASIAIVLGGKNGLSNPTSPILLPNCSAISGIAAADFNGDGYLDLAVACSSSNSVSAGYVLFGDPALTFERRSAIPLPHAPFSVAAGDFNGDGIVDVAFGDGPDPHGVYNYLAVALGTGDGKFGDPAFSLVTGGIPATLIGGSFFGNGRQDLVVVEVQAGIGEDSLAVELFKSNGDGTFTAQPSALGSLDDYWCAVADLNADGNADLACVGNYLEDVNLFFGDGAGQFASRALSLEHSPTSLAAADLNGDGTLDLVTGNDDGSISISYGSGAGHFKPAVNYAVNTAALWAGTGHFVSADEEDIVVLDQNQTVSGPPSYSLVRNEGKIDARPLNSVVEASFGSVADVNGDGVPDLVVTENGNPSALQVVAGRPNGTFVTALATIPLPNQSTQPLVADFNGDGLPDIAVGPYSTNSLLNVALQNTGGTFTLVQTLLPWDAEVLFAGDLNGDGKTDIIVGQVAYGYLEYPPTQLYAMLGNGDGSFQNPLLINVSNNGGPVFGDFNRDGNLDIVTVSLDGPVLLTGNGDGTFAAPVLFSTLPATAIASGDFNGDGNLDIAAVSNGLYLLLGNGNGTFTQMLSDAQFPNTANQLLAADLNGDGKLDLVAYGTGDGPSEDFGFLAVFEGLGNGSFVAQSPQYFSDGSPFLADMNKDGLPDLVLFTSSSGLAGSVSTLFNLTK